MTFSAASLRGLSGRRFKAGNGQTSDFCQMFGRFFVHGNRSLYKISVNWKAWRKFCHNPLGAKNNDSNLKKWVLEIKGSIGVKTFKTERNLIKSN